MIKGKIQPEIQALNFTKCRIVLPTPWCYYCVAAITAYHRFAGSEFVLQFWRCVEVDNLLPSSMFLSCQPWKNRVNKLVNNRSFMGEAGVVGRLSLMGSKAKAGMAGLDGRKVLSWAEAVGTSLSPVGFYLRSQEQSLLSNTRLGAKTLTRAWSPP